MYMQPADTFPPLKHLFSSFLNWSGSVCAPLPSLGLFLSLGNFKWHYLSSQMIGPIRSSLNKRHTEAQQKKKKKQFLEVFRPKSLILCFCHVTFRFVCGENAPRLNASGFNKRSHFSLSEMLTLQSMWWSIVTFLGFTNVCVQTRALEAQIELQWRRSN